MPDIKLGSLFDGIGVFPLAAVRCGIVPAWASEIEKAPISITKRHFPGMVDACSPVLTLVTLPVFSSRSVGRVQIIL
jgi:site-specific DNA-cytosine methylase